jgi:hypothetical protein
MLILLGLRRGNAAFWALGVLKSRSSKLHRSAAEAAGFCSFTAWLKQLAAKVAMRVKAIPRRLKPRLIPEALRSG